MSASARDSRLRAARALAALVFPLAAWAAVAGATSVPAASNERIRFRNLWESEVILDGGGIYRLESVSGAAQERAQDLVTLAFALPALAVAIAATKKGSAGSRVFLSGILGYFLYGYGLLAFGAVYNPMFLAYVAVFSLSLFAFILAFLSVDAEALGKCCAARYPRRLAIAVDVAVALLLAFMWLARIVPGLPGGIPPRSIDGYHTLFVQAGDLGIIVPAALLSAWSLYRRKNEGWLLGTVLFVKGAAMGLAVACMGVAMNLSGAGEDAPIPLVAAFFCLAALCAAGTFLSLRSMKPSR